MTVTSILYILLVISTNYQLSVQSEDNFHMNQTFNCPADDNTIQIDISEHNLRSISLLSPCYPNSYYGQCVYQREVCYVVVYNIPDNMWIGLFVDEEISVPQSNHELILLTHEPEEDKFRLNSLMPGFLHRFTQYNNEEYTIGFFRDISDSTEDDSYKFKIDTRMAYVLEKSYGHERSVTAGNGGYIVSHEKFDYGTDINNYYLDDIVVELALTGLSADDMIHVTFRFFDLHFYYSYWGVYCDDYLEVRGIRGYPRNRARVCGYDEPMKYVYELYPVGGSITFRFVTKSYWRDETSAGFLLEYKVMKEMKCPPHIQNANKGVQVEGTEVYIIECKANCWTENRSNIQRVDCTSDIWQSTILPCILIECDLPEISTDSELNFTLSSRGRATVGTNISYLCNSKRYELTDGTEISICTSNGEWNSPTPRCTLIKTTETTPVHTETSRHKTDGNTTTMASKQETESLAKTASSTAGYIGGGVGACVVTLIVVVVLLLLRRRNRGTEKSSAPNNKTKRAKVKSAESIDRADIYYLATEGLGRTDIHATSRTDNTYTDVYELAEHVENPESADVSSRNYGNYEEVLTSPVDSSDISFSATAKDELDASNGPSAARDEVYELADATDDYDNHAAIERSERERDITYAPVLAVNKRKFTADDADVMVDNELYGT